MAKEFICVIAEHDVDGSTKPVSIRWNDGRVFSVDRVLDVRQAPALKSGGLGMRYHCRIHGRHVYLFEDDGRWFLEPISDSSQQPPLRPQSPQKRGAWWN